LSIDIELTDQEEISIKSEISGKSINISLSKLFHINLKIQDISNFNLKLIQINDNSHFIIFNRLWQQLIAKTILRLRIQSCIWLGERIWSIVLILFWVSILSSLKKCCKS